MSDMSELFTRDPLQLSQQDLDRIITYFRQKRNAKPLVASKLKRKPKPRLRKPKVEVPGLSVDLSAL